MNPITAAALGAGMMYLFDPEQGQTRRAKIQDKFQGLVQQTKDEFDLSLSDLQNRAECCARDLRASFSDGEPTAGLHSIKNELTQWTPATRLLAVAGGGALAACVAGAISPKALMLAGLGAGVCAAVINRERLEQMAAEAMLEAGSGENQPFAEEVAGEPVRASRQ